MKTLEQPVELQAPGPDPSLIDSGMGLFTMTIRQILLTIIMIALFVLFQGCGHGESGGQLSGEELDRYNRALGLYSEGRYEEAAGLISSLGGAYAAQVLRGKALFFSETYAEAEKTFRKALDLRPSSVEARLYLAFIQRASGSETEARRLAEDILVDDPGNLRAYRLLVDLTEDQQNKGALLNQALDSAGDVALLFVERARSRWIAGDGSGALQDLAAALALLPSDSIMRPPVESLRATIAAQTEGNGQ